MTEVLPHRLTPSRWPVLVPGVEQRSRVFQPDLAAVPDVVAFVRDALDAWGVSHLSTSASHAVPALAEWILEHDRCPLGFVVTAWIDHPLVFVDMTDRSSSLPEMRSDPGPKDQDLYIAMAAFAEDWGAEVAPLSRCLWLSLLA